MLSAVVLLICFGLAAIYSIAISADQPNFLNFQKQIVFAIGGIIILFLVAAFDYRIFHTFSGYFYFSAVALLLLVLFFGQIINNTKGWFTLFGLNFQPVEIAKVALVIYLADFFTKKPLTDLSGFLYSGVIAAVPTALVLLQPDFGSAAILFFIWLAFVIFIGTKKKYLFGIGFLLAVIFLGAWFYFFADYQKERILTFLNPQADPYGRGYHVRQAVIAVGAGGLFGRGLGFGSQSQLKFIPASQTDFIFAVIAEELGFLGVGLILLFWFLIFYRLVQAAGKTRDEFSGLVIFGISIIFFSHVFINVGMNIGILPVTGISLPFLSYGGSFLVVCLLCVGIVQSIIVRGRT